MEEPGQASDKSSHSPPTSLYEVLAITLKTLEERLETDRSGWPPPALRLVCKDWRAALDAWSIKALRLSMVWAPALEGMSEPGNLAALLAAALRRRAARATSATLSHAVLRSDGSLDAEATAAAYHAVYTVLGPRLRDLELDFFQCKAPQSALAPVVPRALPDVGADQVPHLTRLRLTPPGACCQGSGSWRDILLQVHHLTSLQRLELGWVHRQAMPLESVLAHLPYGLTALQLEARSFVCASDSEFRASLPRAVQLQELVLQPLLGLPGRCEAPAWVLAALLPSLNSLNRLGLPGFIPLHGGGEVAVPNVAVLTRLRSLSHRPYSPPAAGVGELTALTALTATIGRSTPGGGESEQLPSLAGFTALQQLELYCSDDRSPADPLALPLGPADLLPALSSLALLGFPPALWRDHGLGELPALCALEIHAAGDSPLVGLGQYSLLTSLELSRTSGAYGNRLALTALGGSLAAYPRLQRLSLRDCGLREFPEGLTELRQLRAVELSGNNFESIPPETERWAAEVLGLPAAEAAAQWLGQSDSGQPAFSC